MMRATFHCCYYYLRGYIFLFFSSFSFAPAATNTQHNDLDEFFSSRT